MAPAPTRLALAWLLGVARATAELEAACATEVCTTDQDLADLPNLSLLQAEHRLANEASLHTAGAEVAHTVAERSSALSLRPRAEGPGVLGRVDELQGPVDLATGADYAVTQLDRDMARVAQHIYNNNVTAVPNWSRTKFFQNGKDMAGIYTNGRQCAVSFSGSNDWGDWITNANAFGYDLTFANIKTKVHQGFFRELRRFLTSSAWPEFLATLQSCGEIMSVGHSLGGALASLFAAVVNANSKSITLPIDGTAFPTASTVSVGGIQVSRLFTFGAPGVSFGRQLTNARDWGIWQRNSRGTFEGNRFFNAGDPVPCITRNPAVLLVHPQVQAVRISLAGFFSTTPFTEAFAADSEQARELPGLLSARGPALHSMSTYVERLR